MALVKTVTLRVLADAGKAQATLDDLTAKGDALGAREVKMRFRVPGGDEGIAQLKAIGVQADRLGLKDAVIRVRVDGAGRAIADLMAVRAAADGGGGGILSRLAGGIGGLAGTALPAGIPVIGGMPALGWAGIAAAAAPFLAQAAGGLLVTGFGGALAGMGILGALGGLNFKDVKKSFADLKTSANADLAQIGKPFVPALNSIFATASSVMAKLTPVFAGAEKIIAGPLKAFADTLLKAFTQPAVVNSINAVAKAFGSLLTAVTPALPGMIASIATGITAVANAVGRNPKAFAQFAQGLARIGEAALLTVAALTRVAAWIETNLPGAFHRAAVVFDGVRHEIAHVWDQVFSNTIGTVIRLVHNVETQFDSLRHGIAVKFDQIRHDIAHAFDGAIGWLVQAGKNIIQGLINGITSMAGSVLSAAEGIGKSVLNAIGSPFGIHFSEPSQATMMVKAGRQIARGLMTGMGMEMPALRAQLAGVTRTVTAGTGSYAGGGGGNVYITVNAPVGANLRETGRQLAEAILAHTSTGGRLYRPGTTPR